MPGTKVALVSILVASKLLLERMFYLYLVLIMLATSHKHCAVTIINTINVTINITPLM